jgi:putative membrane protein insertion efficiency factor
MPKRPPSSREPSTSGAIDVASPGFVSWVLLRALRVYQLLLSPLFPLACRFAPSCSAFAAQAIERHGAREGIVLAMRRVVRCHPWHAGGYDPVPPRRG